MGNPVKALLIVRSNIVPAREAEYHEWYNKVHLPDMLKVPGVLSARRYEALWDEPKYAAIYELESAEVLETDAYKNVRFGRRDGGLPAKYPGELTGYVRHAFRLIHDPRP